MNGYQVKFSLSFLILLFITACGDNADEEIPIVLNECGHPTNDAVEDRRCLYTMSTLTQTFNGSGGLTVDATGFIYVANFGSQLNIANGTKVHRVDPNTGAVSLFATGLDGASGNTFDATGNLIQANIRGNKLSKITPDGTVTTIASDKFFSPVGVTVDKNGDFYVCNCGNDEIIKVTPDGATSVFVSSPILRCPNGITIDDNGNFYVANFRNGVVAKITPSGDVSELASLPGSQNGHIDFANGKLYVAGRRANKIFEVTLDGKAAQIAGTGQSGNADGNGNQATMNIPNGIQASPDGTKIYVSDRIVGQGSPLNPVVVRVIELK